MLNGILSGEGEVSDKVTKIIGEYNKSVLGLKEKNQNLILTEKGLKTKITELETKSGEYETQVTDLTEQLKKKVEDKSAEEFYNNQLAKEKKVFEEALAKLTAERDEFKKYKIENLKTQEIAKGIDGLKFVDKNLEKAYVALVLSENRFEPKEIDGQTVFLNDEQKLLSDVLKEYALTENGKSFIANSISGGGAKGSVKTNTGSMVNPFKRETRSLKAQNELFKTNPELARQLASEAGIKL